MRIGLIHAVVAAPCATGRRIIQLEPGLEQLKKCFAWIFFLTCVLNLCVMVGMQLYLNTYVSMIATIQVAGDRQVLSQVMARLAACTPSP